MFLRLISKVGLSFGNGGPFVGSFVPFCFNLSFQYVVSAMMVCVLSRRCAMQVIDSRVVDNKSHVVSSEYISPEMDMVPRVSVPVLVPIDDRVSMSAKHVFYALRSYLFFGKKECFPSINALCRRVGLSKKRVGALLKELEEFGLIKRKLKPGVVSRYEMAGRLESVYCDRNGHLTEHALSMLVDAGFGHAVKRIRDSRTMNSAMVNGHNSDVLWQYNVEGIMPLQKCEPKSDFLFPDQGIYDGLKASVDMIARDEFFARKASRNKCKVGPRLEVELEALIESTVDVRESEFDEMVGFDPYLEKEAFEEGSESGEEKDMAGIQGKKVMRKYESLNSRSVKAEERREKAKKLRAATPPTEEELIMEEAKKEHRKSTLRLKDVCDFFDAVRQHKWPGAPNMTRDGKNLKNVRRLMDAFGAETTCDALEKIVESWEDIVERYGIGGPPTISVIKAFAESWFHEVLVGKIEKKSAMDRMRELGEYDAKNDNNKEVATFF